MAIYLFVSITLLIIGLWYESANEIIKLRRNKKLPKPFYIVPSFSLLLFISAFRGDFTTDYTNYTSLFKSINSYSFWTTFKVGFDIELGYLLLNRVIGLFTTNPVFLFAVTSFVILYGFYHQFSRYSVNIWLSVLMFVTAGSFYASFNITRQILAAAIIFMGSKYLYERKFFKYVLVVIIASLIHTSSLIMIPFYFILNLRLNFKNFILVSGGSAVIFVFFDQILDVVQMFVYENYTENAYGMTGQAFENVVLPLAFLAFTLYHIKKIEPENIMHRIWFNAVYYYAFFNVLGLQVQMVERISRFFAPYVLLLIPFIFSKMQNKHLRFVYSMVLIFLLILYNYVILSGSVFDPYYFIWEK